MNIVKLKDILMPETSIMGEFFNKNLKVEMLEYQENFKKIIDGD